jgi:hypothetical protein
VSASNAELLRYLLEYRSKSISESFEDMLTKYINIREGIRSIASTSQQNLREFLQNECQRDLTFPRVLKRVDSDFMGGSFARHTKIRPLDDIDIYVPLDGANLHYRSANGTLLPFTVLSDCAGWNPVLTPRWADGQLVSSLKLINEFTAVLKRRFSQTKVKDGGQAVSIRMTHGETSDSDGLGYDVVPCFSLRPERQGDHSFYLIPDGRNGWTQTNPRIDAMVAGALQRDHAQTFRKAVKIVKYWTVEYLTGKINSYFIELSSAKIFRERSLKSESVATLPYAVALAFWAVQQSVARGVEQSWLPGAPLVYPGAVASGDIALLKAATDQACFAWEDEKAGRMASAARKWKLVYGDEFPD